MTTLRPRRIRELVRQFKENGMKMMLEDPANVRDVLGLLDVAWRDDIDFSHLDQVKTTFKAGYSKSWKTPFRTRRLVRRL
jgi:hypothetical protein